MQRFFSIFKDSFEQGEFVKCTLGKPSSPLEPGLENVYIRPVDLKGAMKLAFTYRFKTRDEVKNYALEEALMLVKNWLGNGFSSANLFTTAQEVSAMISKKGKVTLSISTKKTAELKLVHTAHNREKKRLIDADAPWLRALGITNAQGVVLAQNQDKWRQINKFIEVIESMVHAGAIPADARICDMGSGKGYLTFALYDFLKNKLGLTPHITGVELRPGLVDFCNKTAQQAGFSGLDFEASDISKYPIPDLDMLIALHACDTATDLAIASGVKAGAKAIIVAPCCHKQIRREMAAQNELAPVLQHGILEERQAEIVTDGIRALLMETQGYKTQVFEFISTEHTAKNVMITGVRRAKSQEKTGPLFEKIAAIKAGFGIKQHFLETLLSLVFLFFALGNVGAQGTGKNDNIIPNPGFERYAGPPIGWFYKGSHFAKVIKYWFSATTASPDAYGPTIHVPQDWADKGFGTCKARGGKTMAGITVYGCVNGKPHCREYIEIQLAEPLVIGQTYYYEMWVARLSGSLQINNIGVHFTEKKVEAKTDEHLSFKPQVFTEKILRSGANKWTKISGKFIAETEAEYAIIGNFFEDEATATEVAQSGLYNYAYYYVDDVVLRKSPPILPPKPDDNHFTPLETGRVFVLRDIYFEFDKSELMPRSYVELNKLLVVLRENPKLKLEIIGHTDSDGTHAYNEVLSVERAQSVYNFLTTRGIKTNRLSLKGMGERQPVVANDSEEDKQKNRRVEVRVTAI